MAIQLDAEKIELHWNRLREQIRKRWPQLTEAELRMIDGDSQKLVALIHQKTGSNLVDIQDSIDQIASGSQGLMQRGKNSVKTAGDDFVQSGAESVLDAAQPSQRRIEGQPTRAVAAAFGIAFTVGLGLSLLCFRGKACSR